MLTYITLYACACVLLAYHTRLAERQPQKEFAAMLWGPLYLYYLIGVALIASQTEPFTTTWQTGRELNAAGRPGFLKRAALVRRNWVYVKDSMDWLAIGWPIGLPFIALYHGYRTLTDAPAQD